jgi:hypothetical protein
MDNSGALPTSILLAFAVNAASENGLNGPYLVSSGDMGFQLKVVHPRQGKMQR